MQHLMNKPIAINIEKMTLDNEYYRYVYDTSHDMQLVFMSLLPKDEIGMEIHKETQFIKIEKGSGLAILNDRSYPLKAGSAVFIPGGTHHNIINTGKGKLKLYTIYAPPHHPYDRKNIIL